MGRMSRYLAPHTFIIAAGLVVGVLFGVFVMQTPTPIFGLLFGAGMGLLGGAFVAAIASGQQLISGPRPNPRDLEWLDEYEDDIPRLLDDLPPRRDAGAE